MTTKLTLITPPHVERRFMNSEEKVAVVATAIDEVNYYHIEYNRKGGSPVK